MRDLTRRRFLASAAAAAVPVLGAPHLAIAQSTTAYDVVIIGAGAAGIAAARRLAATGRSCLVLEAAARAGGRCLTDSTSFDAPYDRGANWLYQPAINPVAALARTAGLPVTPVSTGHRLRMGSRFAREIELERHLVSLVRVRRAILSGANRPRDAAAGAALPREIGDWRGTADLVLGHYRCGKSLDAISVRDLARSADRDLAVVPGGGCGALLETLTFGLPIQLSTPARRVTLTRGVVTVETDAGRLLARAVLLTCSTSVLAGGGIAFDPPLPREHQEALAGLSLGHRERVAIELRGNPLGLGSDVRVFPRVDPEAGTAGQAVLLANPGGAPLAIIDLPGAAGRDLAARGEEAMTAFALDWLVAHFGADVRKAAGRSQATRWSTDPLIRGAFSAAAPGVHAARATLMQPARERIHFAGEAAHETLWGTVGGAWESGERAADAILAQFEGRTAAAEGAGDPAGGAITKDPGVSLRRRSLRPRR